MTRELSDLPCKKLDWFHIQYIVRLIQKGLATIDRWVYEQDLLESFLDFYGREFLEVLGIQLDNRFLFQILQLSPSVFDPVMHLLMIRFLTNSVDKFFASRLKYKPFGKAPWPCLNPACEHYLKFVVTHLTMPSSREPDSPYSYLENPLGIFSCNCGFIYTRRGVDTTELDKFRFETIEAYGQLWSQKYLEFAETDRLRFEETALKLSCNYGGKSPNKMLRRLEAFWKSLNSNSKETQDG
ncbi:MAG: hypothetical protein JO235_08285 [Chroococcidiopsidaceae cyanobacterium CP_BM_RX_35]|nr:hypothetical protein [Chroococcidiopsidaceae cyanobacterium CP_BM_RX_35]